MDNDKNTNQKNRIIQAMQYVEYSTNFGEDQQHMEKYTKFPFSKILTLGSAFEPVVSGLQNIVGAGNGKSGLYWASVPKGRKLASFNKESAFLGSVLNESGAVGGGQARLHSLPINPGMIFMAAALTNIDAKLNEIQKTQQEILGFLIQKERSELKGDLIFLADILNNYKYNWDNDKYKNSNHIKVLDIRQTAERKIGFYREQIKLKINKKSLFSTEQSARKQLETMQTEYKDYQLSLYLYSFSSFHEVMLLENFDSEYLERVSDKLEKYSFMYRELYTESYNYLEEYSKTSIESNIINKLASFNKFAGNAISKAPIISNSQLDEKLIETGNKLGKFSRKRTEDNLKEFVEKQSSYIRPFIEHINTINKLYNETVEILFDEENLYIL